MIIFYWVIILSVVDCAKIRADKGNSHSNNLTLNLIICRKTQHNFIIIGYNKTHTQPKKNSITFYSYLIWGLRNHTTERALLLSLWCKKSTLFFDRNILQEFNFTNMKAKQIKNGEFCCCFLSSRIDIRHWIKTGTERCFPILKTNCEVNNLVWSVFSTEIWPFIRTRRHATRNVNLIYELCTAKNSNQ